MQGHRCFWPSNLQVFILLSFINFLTFLCWAFNVVFRISVTRIMFIFAFHLSWKFYKRNDCYVSLHEHCCYFHLTIDGEKDQLCYINTDSFIIHTKPDYIFKETEDTTEDVETRFDTSNYEFKRPLPKENNTKIIGLMRMN